MAFYTSGADSITIVSLSKISTFVQQTNKNLKELPEDIQHSCKDDALIKENFFELFNSRIEFGIFQEHKDFMSSDYELMNLWSSACNEDPKILKGAFIDLINNLRAEDAIDVDHTTYAQIKEKRLQIKKSIIKKGGNRYANYLLELLEFIRRDKFSINNIWTTTLYI